MDAATLSHETEAPPTLNGVERTIEFEFVRATENAALNVVHWLGRGEKEKADAAASDAIYGVFDLVNIRGEVMLGEGIKDKAPGIFFGERLGKWPPGSPRFDIALDPIDGTTNVAMGLPNAVSVIAASQVKTPERHAMVYLPSFYSRKLAYGPAVVRALRLGMQPLSLNDPLATTLPKVAEALGKRVTELVVMMLHRPRNADLVAAVRRCGAALRLIADGDVIGALAPSLPDSGVDLYCGIGGSPEGLLAAAALKALGGDMQLRMWPRDEEEHTRLLRQHPPEAPERIYTSNDLVQGDSAVFCATGISDSSLLPGVKLVGAKAITHSILTRARSRTVRYIRAVHDLDTKTIPLRSDRQEHRV